MGHTTVRPTVKASVSGLANLVGKPIERQEYVDRDQGKITASFTPEQWRLYRSYYLDLIEKTDALLGQVLDSVDLDSTIILYTSDHGDQLGEHGLPFKGPFLYDKCLRVPLILSAPGRLKAGHREHFVHSADRRRRPVVPKTVAAGIHLRRVLCETKMGQSHPLDSHAPPTAQSCR